MSSIMRWRRGEIGLVIGGLLSTGLHNVQSSQTGCSAAMVTPPPPAIGKGQEKGFATYREWPR
jgi:hypothetical protein